MNLNYFPLTSYSHYDNLQGVIEKEKTIVQIFTFIVLKMHASVQ